MLVTPREECGPEEGQDYKSPERLVWDFSRHSRSKQRSDVWPQDQHDSEYRPGQDERRVFEYRDDKPP